VFVECFCCYFFDNFFLEITGFSIHYLVFYILTVYMYIILLYIYRYTKYLLQYCKIISLIKHCKLLFHSLSSIQIRTNNKCE
jgi:hypothetical protein